MSQAALHPLTVQDYFDLPEGSPRYQLVDGDLFMMPPPNLFHQSISVTLAAIIKLYLRSNPIGKVWCAPVGVILNEMNAFEPDVAFVSKERKSILSERGIEGAPDFVVEILSPGTERFDRGVKRAIYARAGVNELWLIDPKRREIQVFHLGEDAESPAAVHAEKDRFESRTFPKLKFDCAEIFER